MPSTSALNLPVVEAVASPPSMSSAPAMTSYVVSRLDLYFQLFAALQQNVSNLISQDIAQAESDIEQLVDRLESINPNASNSSSSSAALQASGDSGMGRGNSSGSGSGSSASTTHNSPNQPLNNSTQQGGNGSGSGSSATTTHAIASKQGVTLHPMTSGTGTGTGSGFVPQVYFGSGSYSVPESGSGSGAELEVELSAPVNKTVTVNYQTTNGSAIAGTDYTTESGTLTFQPNVTSQYITVPVLDDGSSDDNTGSQTFTASLSGPTNATLGSPSTTTVQIMEQDTVSGQVWLDNNGDGYLNNGEMGYYGDSVSLYSVIDQNGDDPTLVDTVTTTTNPYGNNFQFVVPASYLPGPGPSYFEIGVGIPQGFYATKQPGQSQINNAGFSPAFALAPGGAQNIKAGLRSMVVTTTDDDPNGPLSQDQDKVTLRDAIQTGNNGPPAPAVTFGSAATGTISLQAALEPIETSYNVQGPGANNLAVNGNDNAGSIFTVNAGVTSTISGLTIEGGSNGNGGGVFNSGDVALIGDTITSDKTTGNGGGIDNGNGTLTLSGCQILGNNAGGVGGGLYNAGGTVTIAGGTVIKTNKAPDTIGGHGGGIYNASGKVTVSGGTVISTNSAGTTGGGVYNGGTFSMTGGEIIRNTVPPTTGGGGGVFNRGSMKLLGVQVQTNSAGEGGGIFTAGGQLVLGQDTMISGNNYASLEGGGLFVQSGTAALVGGGVTNNTAAQDGGGIYVYGGQLMLSSGVLVSGNTAIGSSSVAWGGGIFIRSGKVTVSGGTIRQNTAAGCSGGGIYNFGGTLTLQDSVNIKDNWAQNQGGGIYLANGPSTTTFNGVTVSGNKTNGSQQTTGWGVYWQNNATVNGLPNGLTDNDDPNGKPVPGP